MTEHKAVEPVAYAFYRLVKDKNDLRYIYQEKGETDMNKDFFKYIVFIILLIVVSILFFCWVINGVIVSYAN